MTDDRITGDEAHRREVLADASCEVVCYQHAADVPMLLKDVSMDGEGLHVEVGQCSVCAAERDTLRADLATERAKSEGLRRLLAEQRGGS